MKNILINIPEISKNNGGIYQYSLALLHLVAKDLPKFKFYILCYDPEEDIKNILDLYDNVQLVDIQDSKKPILEKFKRVVLDTIYKTTGFKRELNVKDIYDQIIEQYSIDIIHTPYQDLVKKNGVKSITTLHDVQELHFPEFFSSGERATRALNYKRYIDGADAVIVSYNHVKNDINKFFNKPAELIHVILLDMVNLWFNNLQGNSANVIKKYKIPSKFFLYPASTWEHKNHINLLQAFKECEIFDSTLVCTGNKTDYFSTTLLPYIKKYNLENKVKFLGVVDDKDLFGLYQACQAVVIPSVYEAGSFPLMESILMKIPVICSDVTSLPDTIGDRRFTFDPNNIDDIIDKMNKIWSNTNYRDENLKVLEKQSKILLNNNSAIKLKNLYNEL
ncbi:glycosyltransferase family 4 protein [Christiangramia salexigens]|uniref:Uncharacterized protein n=1 Tax=Christiangramia salexigens TaxID=1913577 RepID=A0A1L3J4Q6_9FLAO|nr:glycosyltransferase family 1 protein [Christiangramia salexigens]APG60118.1 hypothetical protein LPB144_06675 [Christiangramia salexigens]